MSHAGPQTGLQRTFSSLRNYNYRLFWAGGLVSLTGTWMQNTALSYYALRLSHNSPLAVSLVSTFQFLPLLLFLLVGGVVADRFPKRPLLLGTQTVMLLQALTLATLTVTGRITLVEIYALVSVSGVANALDNPVRQAFRMEMVGPADLPNAVALGSTQGSLSRMAGPAISGGAVALLGYAACFYLNAASFLAVLGALLAMRPAGFFTAPPPQQGRLLPQVKQGLHYAVNEPDIALVMIMLAVIGVFGFNNSVFIPLIAKFQLHASAGVYGLLASTLAIGSVIATLAVAYAGTAKRLTLVLSGGVFSLVLASLALSRWVPVSVVLLVAMGLSSTVFTATASTRMQMLTKPELRGRVMSIFTLLFLGSTPIGALICGGLSEVFGVQAAIVSMAAVCGLGVVAGLVYMHRNQQRLRPET